MINRYLIKFYARFAKTYLKKRYKEPCFDGEKKIIKNIAVLYSIPLASPRFNTWNDGFVDAIRKLSAYYSITWINVETGVLSEQYLNEFDFILVKSNWDWGPDKLLREKFRNIKAKKGLAISGVSLTPSFKEMMYYDVLWYETNWYKAIIQNHPNIYHAFGINQSEFVKPLKSNIEYDYISIGAFLPHKRMHLLSKLKGNILVIGEEYDTTYSKNIISFLNEKENVDLHSFVEYSQLPNYLCKAKTLYIPAMINGGGERAILEGRYCGLNIKIEPDNFKLKELLTSPIWDSQYYFEQLREGIKSISVSNPIK